MSAPFVRFKITYFRGEQNNVYIIFLKIKIWILFYNIFPRNAILWNRSLNFRFAARKKKKKIHTRNRCFRNVALKTEWCFRVTKYQAPPSLPPRVHVQNNIFHLVSLSRRSRLTPSADRFARTFVHVLLFIMYHHDRVIRRRSPRARTQTLYPRCSRISIIIANDIVTWSKW